MPTKPQPQPPASDSSEAGAAVTKGRTKNKTQRIAEGTVEMGGNPCLPSDIKVEDLTKDQKAELLNDWRMREMESHQLKMEREKLEQKIRMFRHIFLPSLSLVIAALIALASPLYPEGHRDLSVLWRFLKYSGAASLIAGVGGLGVIAGRKGKEYFAKRSVPPSSTASHSAPEPVY